MSTDIINLTHQAIVQAITDVLEQYPSHPYQQAFAHPELRQQLIVYVLNQSPNRFVLVEENSDVTQNLNSQVSEELSDKLDEIKSSIRQGIEVIMQEQSDWLKLHIPEQKKPS